MELLAGEFDGANPALSFEQEKVAPFHRHTRERAVSMPALSAIQRPAPHRFPRRKHGAKHRFWDPLSSFSWACLTQRSQESWSTI